MRAADLLRESETGMPTPTLYKFDDIKPRLDRLPEGQSYIKAWISTHNSTSMAGGLNFLNKVSVPWHLTVDEIIYCLQGQFRLAVENEDGSEDSFTLDPGDVIWMPKDMHIRYESDEKCVIFYAVSPVDWKQQQGITFVPGVDPDDPVKPR